MIVLQDAFEGSLNVECLKELEQSVQLYCTVIWTQAHIALSCYKNCSMCWRCKKRGIQKNSLISPTAPIDKDYFWDLHDLLNQQKGQLTNLDKTLKQRRSSQDYNILKSTSAKMQKKRRGGGANWALEGELLSWASFFRGCSLFAFSTQQKTWVQF